MARALATFGWSRHGWRLLASVALSCGIWSMHFIAMLGFGIADTDVHYDVPLTLFSLLLAVVVVGMGIFSVGYGQSKRRLMLGGLGTGLGIAGMHYVGMAALRLHGHLTYSWPFVAVSVVVAVLAATSALWAALSVSRPWPCAGAALAMGLAVSCMHHLGMAALRVRVIPARSALPGASGTDFIVPLTILVGSFLFLTAAFVALSPSELALRASASAT
ncbi:MHYT domain-containing protein [Streptomyces sp. NPDC006733]|uniref:MHYT domain-containing protein n=1 Tax=Streptomyces sp. NPDC006733 TaxID=3155460 RepID=UPI00340F9A6C